jgi:hypothetical protein
VLEIDKDGIVRSCSPAVEQLLGYTAVELVGLEAYSLLHPDDLLHPQTDRSATPARTAATSFSKARLTRRDELGFVAGVVTVLRDTADLTSRTAEQRIHDAVALEPDPVELFSIVAEEVALELQSTAAAVVRFESGGFGTVVGACEPRGSVRTRPARPCRSRSDEPAAIVFRTGEQPP